MKKLKSYEIRQMWLDFFKEKGHEIIPSASLVPHDDPTLLWINAGVAPLKKYFDGREKPVNPRMTNAQKSIRTNDIDNVGRTSRHHTFFEMLGNFSIGDYFRDEVIPWAAELLFDEKWFGFPKDLIYITYYPEDINTFNAWVSAGVAKEHLVPLEGNFWEIGEGPCGPDTEIFFDRGVKYDPENIGIRMLEEDIDNDRYIEIWNIVFSQFNSVTGLPREQYPELPSKNIDTGSGLERLACIFQGTDTNYETDLFLPLIEYVENYSGKKYAEDPMAFRVIADHIRSVSFAVADGAMLSNEGRGYVLRRILRRAVRYGRKLGIHEPFLYKMVGVVVENMKSFYGYLVEKQSIIERIVKTEEENFLRTLENGEKKLNEVIKATKESGSNVITGKDTFLLYDTFGFPLELTEESAFENNCTIDIEGFKKELNAQKERARAARNTEQSMNTQNEDFLNFKVPCTFVGYDTLSLEATVTGIFKDGKLVEAANGEVIVILDKTPFYAEMGGQVGDNGTFTLAGNSYLVYNTFKLPNGQHAHNLNTQDFTIKVNDVLVANVDDNYRSNVCKNHSGTHLLNESLRKVLGSHVVQHGSLCAEDRLRFDFNHFNNLSTDEILAIEKLTNDAIKASYPVITKVMPLEEAKKKRAQALFGEKYGDTVRVVDMDYSVEFCGGTHVSNTLDIEKLAIISIESKGSGIFRAEALTGDNIYPGLEAALAQVKEEVSVINQKLAELSNKAREFGLEKEVKPIVCPKLIGSYQDIINYRNILELARKTLKDFEKEVDAVYREKSSASYKDLLDDFEVIGNKSVLIKRFDNTDADVLKDIIDKVASSVDSCVIFAASVINESKIIFVAKAKNLNVNCGQLVKNAAIATGGNGGGRPDFAQAGGKDASKLDVAFAKVRELLA